eukprot:Skav219222  [mRNA]  locus=scaffold1015:129953:134150:+ [translate_table: standard]
MPAPLARMVEKKMLNIFFADPKTGRQRQERFPALDLDTGEEEPFYKALMEDETELEAIEPEGQGQDQTSTRGTSVPALTQEATSVQVTEASATGSGSQGTSSQVSATVAEPPELQRSQSPRMAAGTAKNATSAMMFAALTWNIFGVGISALVGPVSTSGNPQHHVDDLTNFSSLESVGLSHLSLPGFSDFLMDQHLVVSSAVDASWILFDSGAAAHCHPKNFAPEWPLLPINGSKPPLRSVTGRPLHAMAGNL